MKWKSFEQFSNSDFFSRKKFTKTAFYSFIFYWRHKLAWKFSLWRKLKSTGFLWRIHRFFNSLHILYNPRAMLLVTGTIVCLICYCCHRKSKMRSSLYMQHRWYDRADSNMEIYSVEQVRIIKFFMWGFLIVDSVKWTARFWL